MPTETTTRRPRKADRGHSLVALARVTDRIGFPVRVIGTCECGKKISNKGGYTAEAAVLRRHGRHCDEAARA